MRFHCGRIVDGVDLNAEFVCDASQFVGVRTARGVVVLASDNAYLYENLERHVPIAQTLDSASNLRAQERMTRLAAERRLIVPGHDAEVFVRFPRPGGGVAKIE